MSTVRGKIQEMTILDFSNGKVSRNRIRKSLREVEVIEHLQAKNIITLRDNFIKVGMYKINIYPYCMSTEPRKHLKDYGGLGIQIYESKSDSWSRINIERDKRFQDQSWIDLNKDYRIRVKHLTDIIYHCHKLNQLRAFL